MHELQYIQQDWLNVLVSLERKVAVCLAHEAAIKKYCDAYFASVQLQAPVAGEVLQQLLSLLTTSDSCYCHDDACKLPHIPMTASPMSPCDLKEHTVHSHVSIALGIRANLCQVRQRWEEQLIIMKATTVQCQYLRRPDVPSLAALQLELDSCLVPAPAVPVTPPLST
jgi:hypothetical protein